MNTSKLRRYSLDEIDAMRMSLYAIEYSRHRYPIEGHWIASTSFEDEEKVRSARVEDQLRTYMLGGVGPDEVARKAEDAKAEQKAWYAQERKKLEERRLIAEYGPRP